MASWILAMLIVLLGEASRAQSVFVVDQFNPSGIGTNSYASGQITNVWGNWFGTAFQSLVWDSANDASNNPSSGSMKITLNFNTSNNTQFEVYDSKGIYPPINGLQYTNFQCAVKFAPGSATVTVGGVPYFGYLQFGDEDNGGQDYFGGALIPATATNWVTINLPINPAADPNLTNIYNLLIHIYGPYYSPGLSGASTLWVDNIQFTGTTPNTTNCTVDWNDVHQRIDGFGASSAFQGTWTQAEANMFFSTNTGIGLSLLRSRIVPGGTSIETNIMVMAQALGANVWSTPWSPAATFKSNTNVDGGNFVSSNYQAYANQLAGYVAKMKSAYNINLYALSIQNEPDFSGSYESCLWTPQQISAFVPYLQAALAASNVASTKILLAEDENWQTNYYYAAMTNSSVTTNVAIVACHDYNGSPPNNIPTPLSTYGNPNAALWETEVSTFDPYDGSITNAMYWAERIHLYLTAAQVNAFHYWWLISSNPDNEGLTDIHDNPARRMYVLGNYSRFVRPGFYRIGVANNAFTSVSAYRNTNSGSFAIVAINSSAATVTQVFNLTNFTAGSVTPWITSGALALSNQAPVAVANSSFTYALPAMSVVTFVGTADLAPTNLLLSPSSVGEDLPAGTVIGAFTTAAPFSGHSYTYTFSSDPGGQNNSSFVITNQTLYTTGIFDSQTQGVLSICVRSTDENGLWIENVFPIAVTYNTQARQIPSVSITSDGYLSLTLSGIPASTCQILVATNLNPPVSWIPLTNSLGGGTNFTLSANGLLTNVDYSSTNFPARYYRTAEPAR